MAIGITRGKKNYQEHAQGYSEALSLLGSYREALLQLIDADSNAYTRVMAAYKLPKDSAGREQAIQDGLAGATEIPSRTADCAAQVLRICEDILPIIRPNVSSDLEVGLQMLRSSLKGAIANIRINLAGIKSPEVRSRYEDMTARWEEMLKRKAE